MKFLIAAIIGALIGYTTNWIAIKMLFRPYTEKRFLGIKLPFTPGLIPKEKNRIAKSVGEAVGTELLSSKTIVQYISSEKVNNKISNWVKYKIEGFLYSDKTLEENLKGILKSKYDTVSKKLKGYIENSIICVSKREKNITKIKNSINEKLESVLENNPEKILNTEVYKNIELSLKNTLEGYLSSDRLKNKINSLMAMKIEHLESSDKRLIDLLTDGLNEELKIYVYKNRDAISSYIKDTLREKENSDKFRIIIKEAITNNFGSLVSMFLDLDSILDKLTIHINDYLDKDETREDIAVYINKIIDKIMQIEIKEIIKNIPKDKKNDIIEKLRTYILEEIKNIDTVSLLFSELNNYIENKNSIKDIAKDLNVDLYAIVNDYIDRFVNSSDFNSLVKELVSYFIDNNMKISVKNIIGTENKNISKEISHTFMDVYKGFIKEKGEEIIGFLNISQIVEERIKEFDVYTAEDIILKISHKELKAITWLGAVLGAIIGILSPILNNIY
ncbi:DUF445 family protein [Clostridium oceanicum]|uniref:DUF445 family protein n=1 Tax=Clostridium oceanicum TaxID=1543 RepID=A0ABN1JPC2_9CLOT